MIVDVRDKPHLTPKDIESLNFIRQPSHYVFRRHYRQGMRSHIMEVLDPADVAIERTGVVSNGVKWYPRAKPIRMLRIFRTKFSGAAEAFEEVNRVRLIADHLGPAYFAQSVEFLAHCRIGPDWDILLCGLQEYVTGVLIDPWGAINPVRLAENLTRPGLGQPGPTTVDIQQLVTKINRSAAIFTAKVKQMAYKGGHLPDLAGEGNLILTDDGHLKLVDINNISRVSFDRHIHLDDKHYPVCDKSIEALALLERHLAGLPVDRNEPLYRIYLDPGRMRTVAALEHQFIDSLRQQTVRTKDAR